MQIRIIICAIDQTTPEKVNSSIRFLLQTIMSCIASITYIESIIYATGVALNVS